MGRIDHSRGATRQRAHYYDGRVAGLRADNSAPKQPRCFFCHGDVPGLPIYRADPRQGWSSPRRSCALCADRALDARLAGGAR